MKLFVFSIFFLSVIYSFPQNAGINAPLVLSNISEQNGLSDDHVKCVLKDKEGFIWIGTSDGLNVVDGSTIRVFRHRGGDSTTLASSNIISLTEDSVNELLFIGTNKGLSWYDRKRKSFISAFPPSSPYGASLDIESTIVAGNNKIWCATDGGLFLLDISEKKFTSFFNNSVEEKTDPKYSNKLTYMTADKDGMLWICSNDGFWKFDPALKTYKKIIHQNNDRYYHPLCLYAFIDHEQNIWAGFWNTGLKKYFPRTGELISIEDKIQNDHTISCINEIKQPSGDYALWLNGNLQAFDEKKNSFFRFQQPYSEKKLPALNPLYQSTDGWIWLGSDYGLYIYNPQRQLFNHLVFNSTITSQGVSFYDYREGILIGAADSNFLKWKDKDGKLIKDYSYAGDGTTLHSLQQDGPDDFWIGTGKGILHFNITSGQRSWFRHKESDNQTIPRDFVTCLLIDSKKNLWVFPWREGIWQMDKLTGKCTRLLEGFIPEMGRTKKCVVNDAIEDKNGNIWMADLDEGIILYNSKTNQFSKPFQQQLGPKYGTSRVFVRDNTAWSFINDGLLKWNINGDSVQKISLPSEMNKGLTDMYPDRAGNWWLTSINGLIVYNQSKNTFNRFTTADGLIQNDINGTLHCAANGIMFIGTPDYFTSFDPQLLINSSVSKKEVRITQVLANNRDIGWNQRDPVSLSYKDNNVVIRWALPDYSNPFRNQYYVKLDGIDDDWRYVGNTGEVQYANLSPGKYTIQVQAASANGVLSQNSVNLQFIIHPPFWKTWWFITLVSLIVLTTFILVIRYVSQRNLKEKLLRLEKEQAIEKERNRISRDMHDDLGSGLTKIAIMSEVVKKQIHEPEKAKQQLENISESSRELVDNLQDIIWVLNPKNDTLDSLAAYIREYALKFFEPFETAIHFNYPERFLNIKLSEETRRNLFLVIKETFNNIAKHAWCNNVTITIIQSPSFVNLKIADDGNGFDPEKIRQFGNGLGNMKSRIGQIGGDYKIRSEMGKGAVTTIEIPV